MSEIDDSDASFQRAKTSLFRLLSTIFDDLRDRTRLIREIAAKDCACLDWDEGRSCGSCEARQFIEKYVEKKDESEEVD